MEIFNDMVREFDASERTRTKILPALNAFSIRQLVEMRNAGIRFWREGEFPPIFSDVEIGVQTQPAWYVPELRLIHLQERADTDQIRHELGHVLDNLSAEPGLRRIDKLSAREREKEIMRQHKFDSDAPKLRDMFNQYLGRLPRGKEFAFDNPTTKEGYSKTTSREFFAEGHSVFHGPHTSAQARLLHYAPELYNLLESQAKTLSLRVPDREVLKRTIEEEHLP